MGELFVIAQSELEQAVAAQKPEPRLSELEPDTNLASALSAGADPLVILLDRSGSQALQQHDQRDLAATLAQAAADAGKRVAVYGYSSGHGGEDPARTAVTTAEDFPGPVMVYEYKSVDSPSYAGIEAIPGSGGGGTPTAVALDYLASIFDPSKGGTLLLVTDISHYEPEKAAERVVDLRRAGMQVGALVEGDSLAGFSDNSAQVFGADGYVTFGAYEDLGAKVAAAATMLARLNGVELARPELSDEAAPEPELADDVSPAFDGARYVSLGHRPADTDVEL